MRRAVLVLLFFALVFCTGWLEVYMECDAVCSSSSSSNVAEVEMENAAEKCRK